MMGPAVGRQDRLFYEFNLEERIPPDHLLRRIDAVLDLNWLRADLAPFYSHTGCPSVDPELMVRMLLIGYCYSIRSERRLCREVELNLAYRWFCRLGLEDKVPHHSTFSVNRHGRFRDSDVLRQVFESIVRQCMEMGLVAGEGFAVDASVIEANASRFQRVEGSEVAWTDEQRARRPVREYLAALDGEKSPTNPERKPKALSPSDPAAAWTTRGRHKVMFGYSLNYLIDLTNTIIIDVEATPTRISKRSMPPRRCWSGPSIASPCARLPWPPTSPMAPARCSAGWSGAASIRTSPSGIRAKCRRTASSPAPISPMTTSAILYMSRRQRAEDLRHRP